MSRVRAAAVDRLRKARRLKQRIPYPIRDPHRKTSYSQSGEDLIVQYILAELKVDRVRYVDVGAHHPRALNNTAIFYEAGHRGINIEPNPLLFRMLARARRRDINLNVGISVEPGVERFYVTDPPSTSTFEASRLPMLESEGIRVVDAVEIPTVAINAVLAEHLGAPPEFLSVDAEGRNLEVLQTLDFERFAPTVLCVESTSFSTTGRSVKDGRLLGYVEKQGYLVYADTWINTIFVKADIWLR